MGGVRCIRGLRLPVATVVGMTAEGMTNVPDSSALRLSRLGLRLSVAKCSLDPLPDVPHDLLLLPLEVGEQLVGRIREAREHAAVHVLLRLEDADREERPLPQAKLLDGDRRLAQRSLLGIAKRAAGRSELFTRQSTGYSPLGSRSGSK